MKKPVYLRMCISTCALFSYIVASVHYCMISTGLLRIPSFIFNTDQGVFRDIRNIWCTRFSRKMISVLVRTPFRKSVLKLANFTVPIPSNSGCIIVTCHTPWKRLLLQWILENDFALIITSRNWKKRKKRIKKDGKGYCELREIVGYLRQNGRIILVADNFNKLNNCPVTFLGNFQNVSLFPARLAKIAKVSLITAIPVLRNGNIYFDAGPQVDPRNMDVDSCELMQQIISFLESEIKSNPCIWPPFVN